jgi:hypothetical protein
MRELAQDVRNRFFWRVSPDDKRNHLIDDDAVRAVVSLCDALLARTEAGACRDPENCDGACEFDAAPVADGHIAEVCIHDGHKYLKWTDGDYRYMSVGTRFYTHPHDASAKRAAILDQASDRVAFVDSHIWPETAFKNVWVVAALPSPPKEKES